LNAEPKGGTRKAAVIIVLLIGATLLAGFLIYRSQGGQTFAPNASGRNLSYSPKLRKPAVAGQFYPQNPDKLRDMIIGFLQNAEAKVDDREVGGIIVPHAGYRFSGQVAAWAFKQLEGRHYDTVILVGPSHYHPVKGASVYPAGWYRTPLGDVEIDSNLSLGLMRKCPEIGYDPLAHDREHCLEVEIPFLQVVLGEFKMVAIAINEYDPGLWFRVADAIAECSRGKRVLLVASSDLSHYHPRSVAAAMDQRVVSAVDRFDPVGLEIKARRHSCEMCGLAAVETVMFACQKMGYAESVVLRYGDSAEYSGDTSSVVGYMSAVFLKGSEEEASLTQDEGGQLIELARTSISYWLDKRERVPFETSDPALLDERGAFVTLKEGGRLRGCIGFTLAEYPLWYTVREAAIQAAFHDPRFEPVQAEELPKIKIEVSVLSKLRYVDDPESITIGRDGLYIVGDGRSGLLLPQVPVEEGWDLDEYLRQICRKAGLPDDAWRSSELYAFTAQVFAE